MNRGSSKKIKVFHIITKLELGGAQRVTLQILASLNRELFSPGLITSSQGMLLREAMQIDDLQLFLIPSLVREISPSKDLKALFKIRKILRSEKVALVHTHCSKAGVVGRWAAYLAGVPIRVHGVHGFAFSSFLPWWRRWLYILIEKLTSKITTHFFVDSQANAKQGRKYRLFRRGNYSQVPPGIPLSQFVGVEVDVAGEKERLGIGPGEKVVGMIACFKPQKAPLDFIRLAGRVMEHLPETRFLLVGDGELREEVEGLVRQLGLEGRVILTGWRWDIPQIIALCQVIVLTSLWEGMPTVLPMAHAMRKPVVATGVDGSAEVVRDSENGFLVPPHHMEEMAEKVIYLLQHPAVARQMGDRGYRKVGRYDYSLMVRKQEKLYHQLIAHANLRPLLKTKRGTLPPE